MTTILKYNEYMDFVEQLSNYQLFLIKNTIYRWKTTYIFEIRNCFYVQSKTLEMEEEQSYNKLYSHC